jgi:hypothetical protein
MNNHNLKEKLLSQIKDGKVHMTPRVAYVAQLVALAATSIAIVVVTVFIVNFIFFSMRIAASETLLMFGTHGALSFLYFFPWPLALLDVGLVFLFQWLIRKFKFGYSVPILYVVGTLVVGAFAIGLVIDRGTSFNDAVHERRAHLPPPLRGLYEGAEHSFPRGSGICRCTILSIVGDTLTVEDTRIGTTTLTVILPANDRHATTTGLSVGDTVFIAGEEDGNSIRAFGVLKDKRIQMKHTE